MQPSINTSKRPLILGIVIVVIVFLLLVWLFIARTQGKNAAQIVVVPSSANIEINGVQRSLAGDKIKLEPGEYTVKASEEGFESKEAKLTVDGNLNVLTLTLTPRTAEAKAWAEKNKKQYQDAEKIAGDTAQAFGKQNRDNQPIRQYLPFETTYYRIDYGPADDKENLKLIITADTPVGRSVALERIHSWGFDPTDYQITFAEFNGVVRKN